MTVLVVAVAGLSVIGWSSGLSAVSSDALRRLLESTAVPAPLVFVVLFVVLNTVAVPAPVLGAAAGAAFGAVPGTATTIGAMTLAAALQFLFARRLGGRGLRATLDRRLGRLGTLLARRGVLAVAAVRLAPGPFSEFNLAAGLTSVRFRDFMLGTIVGGMPKAAVWVALGTAVSG